MRSESKIIADTLRLLVKGRYSERKPYIKAFHNDGATINGYTFQKDVWCYLIWKPTDIGEQPQFKGDPLVKVVPTTVRFDHIETVLNAQPWIYI